MKQLLQTVTVKIHRLFGKKVPSAHISRASSRLSLCTCAVTSSVIEKPQTPFREIRIMFMFVPAR